MELLAPQILGLPGRGEPHSLLLPANSQKLENLPESRQHLGEKSSPVQPHRHFQ